MFRADLVPKLCFLVLKDKQSPGKSEIRWIAIGYRWPSRSRDADCGWAEEIKVWCWTDATELAG